MDQRECRAARMCDRCCSGGFSDDPFRRDDGRDDDAGGPVRRWTPDTRDGKDGQAASPENRLGGGAEEGLFQTTQAVRAHDDKICIDTFGRHYERVRWRADVDNHPQ